MLPTETSPSVPGPRKGTALYLSLPVFSWALYDFANTIFSSNVITIFFPFYMQQVIGGSAVLDQIASTFVSYTNAAASLFLVLFSPLFGVLIDRTGKAKFYLTPLALGAIACTIGMGLFALWETNQTVAGLPLSVVCVLLLFMIAKFCYQSSLIFYDTLLSRLGNRQELPLISGFGVAVGYAGTLVGLSVYPLAGDGNYGLVFLASGVLFLVFSLPMFFLFKENNAGTSVEGQEQTKKSFFSGYKEVIATVRDMRRFRPIFLFMLAYFFFNDAIATAIAMMAVYAKAVVGFSSGQFIILYLVATVFSIVGSLLFGHITRILGSKQAVTCVALLLLVAIALGALAIDETMFWVAGSLYGIAMGSTWVTSRTLIVELTPPEKRGQFFGLFAFSGKVSSLVGPLLYGTIVLLLSQHGVLASRAAMGSLAVLVLIGLAIHLRIPVGEDSSHTR
ncbi:MFS transporter [Brevibacillus humidisoli]|uniref:MFS transporter n=1 Tax=Brevibacillus humidisoli TaxID=2895522 RepID=UPI001E4532E8|nr:MFS transporter [Brevibacillus humidisoli]UFJ42334.1 MFS transporter [Brevibacillus humidisoli]